jgi:hypothetical protein
MAATIPGDLAWEITSEWALYWRIGNGNRRLILVYRGTQRDSCQEGEWRLVLARPVEPQELVQPQGMFLGVRIWSNWLMRCRMRDPLPTRYVTTNRPHHAIHTRRAVYRDHAKTKEAIHGANCATTGYWCHSRSRRRRHSSDQEERQAPPARCLHPDQHLRPLAIHPQVRLCLAGHTIAPSTKHALTPHRTYTSIVNSTTKRNYRPDLRQDAVARASAIRKSQRAVKADKPTKTRGAKAQAATASA